MTLPLDLPIVDHHAHLSPDGEGVGAAKRFELAGGTHLFLATQNYRPGVPVSVEAYREQFEITESLARRIQSETRVRVFLVVAPYPIDLLGQIERLGLAAAVELQESALDLAGRWVKEQRAVAIGEIGRPHFPIAPELAEPVRAVFRHAFSVARDAACPALVHCGDLDGGGYRELAELAGSVGFPVHRLVKHYARAVVPAVDRFGVVPSYIARKELLEGVRSDAGPWFFETDFLDDPVRKGAVLDLTTVPKRARAIAARGPEGLELLRIPFVDAVRSVYGFTPVAPSGGPT